MAEELQAVLVLNLQCKSTLLFKSTIYFSLLIEESFHEGKMFQSLLFNFFYNTLEAILPLTCWWIIIYLCFRLLFYPSWSCTIIYCIIRFASLFTEAFRCHAYCLFYCGINIRSICIKICNRCSVFIYPKCSFKLLFR